MIGARKLAWAALAAGAVLASGLSPLGASPLLQGVGPAVVVSPASAVPGDVVRVTISGFGGTTLAGFNACIGFLGPGQNLELGLSPSFRVRLGTVAIGTNGMGAADVRVPAQAASGVYRVTIGGCPPQAGLAPLAWQAETSLTVTRAGAMGLPATGGSSTNGLPVVAALVTLGGLIAIALARARQAA